MERDDEVDVVAGDDVVGGDDGGARLGGIGAAVGVHQRHDEARRARRNCAAAIENRRRLAALELVGRLLRDRATKRDVNNGARAFFDQLTIKSGTNELL